MGIGSASPPVVVRGPKVKTKSIPARFPASGFASASVRASSHTRIGPALSPPSGSLCIVSTMSVRMMPPGGTSRPASTSVSVRSRGSVSSPLRKRTRWGICLTSGGMSPTSCPFWVWNSMVAPDAECSSTVTGCRSTMPSVEAARYWRAPIRRATAASPIATDRDLATASSLRLTRSCSAYQGTVPQRSPIPSHSSSHFGCRHAGLFARARLGESDARPGRGVVAEGSICRLHASEQPRPQSVAVCLGAGLGRGRIRVKVADRFDQRVSAIRFTSLKLWA